MNIKKVSDKTGFTSHTLRYYEKEGVLQEVTRNTSGHRSFSKKDIDILNFIKCLKLTDMPIKELKEITKLWYEGKDNIPQRIEILKSHRDATLEKVDALNKTLNHIEEKILYYQTYLKNNS